MNSIREEDELTSKFLHNACDVVEFKLCRSVADIDNAKPFKPSFAVNVLGEDKNEQIFGYSNLKIELFFTASKLNQYYRKSFTEAIPKTLDGIEPDNIEEALIKSEILQQENGAQSIEHFADLVRQDQKFKPFGRKLHDLSVVYNTLQDSSTRHYEIYFANTQSPGFREWYQRLETFVLWFVDGGIYIDLDDEQWEFFLCFERFKDDETGEDRWAPAGFSTVFKYITFQKDKVSSRLYRPRISQMLVLPPFQRQGIGAELLRQIRRFYSRPDVWELTAEDPNEDFQRTRDFVDVEFLMDQEEFRGPKVKYYTKHRAAFVHAARKLGKMCETQSRRCFEILLLNLIPRSNEGLVSSYRLMIKARLNSSFKKRVQIKRAAILPEWKMPVDHTPVISDEERKQKLQTDFEAIFSQYDIVLERLNRCTMPKVKLST